MPDLDLKQAGGEATIAALGSCSSGGTSESGQAFGC
jgi:hypothetical protein